MTSYKLIPSGTWEDLHAVNLCLRRLDSSVEVIVTWRAQPIVDYGTHQELSRDFTPWASPKEIDFDSFNYANITVYTPGAVQISLLALVGAELQSEIHHVWFMRDGILR